MKGDAAAIRRDQRSEGDGGLFGSRYLEAHHLGYRRLLAEVDEGQRRQGKGENNRCRCRKVAEPRPCADAYRLRRAHGIREVVFDLHARRKLSGDGQKEALAREVAKASISDERHQRQSCCQPVVNDKGRYRQL